MDRVCNHPTRWCALIALAGLCGRLEAQQGAVPTNEGYRVPGGAVQIVCYDDFKGFVSRLDDLYCADHQGFTFGVRPADSLAALQALAFDTTAFAPVATDSLGGAAVAYSAIVKAEPFMVRIAHASLNPKATFSPLAVIVNPSNPLNEITLDRLSRVFSYAMRKPTLSVWSQLGVEPRVGDPAIHPYGLPWSDHYPSEDPGFPDYVFAKKLGGGPPVASYRREETYEAVVRDVAADPDGVGITALNRVDARVKVVAVVDGPWGSPCRGSPDEIRAGRYALDRYVYLFIRRSPGHPMAPWIKAYLDLVLSPQGQKAIADEGAGYLPLNPTEIAEERAKID